jgi:hypothetical protein
MALGGFDGSVCTAPNIVAVLWNLVHCCYTVVTLLLHCLLHCCYTATLVLLLLLAPVGTLLLASAPLTSIAVLQTWYVCVCVCVYYCALMMILMMMMRDPIMNVSV